MRHRERELALQVAQYMQRQYPDVIYRFDLAADMKLTVGQARRNKAMHPIRGYCDLFVAEARHGKHGLFIELKAESPYKKDGTLKRDVHLEEQAEMMRRLESKGYAALFGIGFDHVKAVLDKYLR